MDKSSKTLKVAATWDDFVKEDEVIEKTGYSKQSLQRFRRDGLIKKWSSTNGRKIKYSKSELVELFNFQQTA